MDLAEIHRIGPRTRELLIAPSACPALAARGIVLCGLSWARPPFAFHRHRPDIRQVLLCLTGMGRGWIDGAWQPCGPGQGYLTPSAAPHAYEAEAGKTWEVVKARDLDLYVRAAGGKTSTAPSWQGRSLPMSPLLGDAIRA